MRKRKKIHSFADARMWHAKILSIQWAQPGTKRTATRPATRKALTHYLERPERMQRERNSFHPSRAGYSVAIRDAKNGNFR
jgi:hypothetical protein